MIRSFIFFLSRINANELLNLDLVDLESCFDSLFYPSEDFEKTSDDLRRGTCTAHYIREDVLRKVVLEHIRAVTAYVRSDVESFQEEWLQCQRTGYKNSIRSDKQKFAQTKKRLADINVLISRLYENMVLGTLSKDRYQKMSQGYEAEQAQLNNTIIGLEDWIETREDMNDNLNQFPVLVKKYVEIPELTTTIVNEFIKKIIVYAPDKLNGKRIQWIKIIFNFLGEVNPPILIDQAIIS